MAVARAARFEVSNDPTIDAPGRPGRQHERGQGYPELIDSKGRCENAESQEAPY